MKHAESVTFGGSGLDRAAQLRGDSDALEALRAADTTRILPVWRSKPLFADGRHERLNWVSPGSAILSHAQADVFLGLTDDGHGIFAADMSAWHPQELPDDRDNPFGTGPTRHPDTGDAEFVDLRAGMTRLSPRDAELAATARAILSWHHSHRYCAKCGTQSVPAMAGWQRDCPACGALHFPRTDPVVIMLVTYGNSVLMGRSPGWPRGMYSLLAGFIEPGEPIEAAVRREVYEEAGVRVGAVDYLASQPWPFPTSLMFGCHGQALTRELKIDPSEIEDAVWVTREEMAQVFAGGHPVIRPPRKGAIAQFLLENWLADTLD